MPFYIHDHKVDTLEVDTLVTKFPEFKESSEQLLKQEVRVVGPDKLLYIGQREVAGTSPKDDVISVLGSEDATTCHIAVLRHTGSGATSMIHFDGCQIAEGLQRMIAIIQDLTEDMTSGRLEFHMVGGFLDDRGFSQEVSNKVLKALSASSQDIHLITACITHFNTVYKEDGVPFPVIYGLAVDVKTGQLFRATFPDQGPDLPLRSARHFTGGKENILIYDPDTHELMVGPFDYEKLPHVDIYLSMPNQLIRKYLSTSPEQEPPHFEDNVRASLFQLRDYPDPLVSVFKDGLPRRYTKDSSTGMWMPVK